MPLITLDKIKQFACISYDNICDQTRNYLYNEASNTEIISDELLHSDDFIDGVISEQNPILIDWIKYKDITQSYKENRIADLPFVLLLLKSDDYIEVADADILTNVCLVFMPINHMVIQLSVKQAAQKLEHLNNNLIQQNIYKKLFDKNNFAQMFLDEGDVSKIIEVNHKAEELFQKPAEELISGGMQGLHGKSIELLEYETANLYNGNYTVINLQWVDPEGELRNIQYTVHKLEVRNEQYVHLTAEDVTEKEMNNQQFFRQHEMLRSTLESIDDLFFTLDKEGDFIEYYQAADTRHFSLSNDSFIGKNITEVGFPTDVAQKYLHTVKRVISQDNSEQIDYSLEAFGSKLWYSAKISPRRNVLGVTEGVTVLCRDITRQKKTEQTLKRARDFYLTFFADFPSMIWKTNTAKKVDYYNKTWLEFTGNDLETELKTDWVEKMHISEVSVFLTALLNGYRNKEPFQIEHRLKHHTGEYRWVLNAARPHYNMEGQFSGFVGSCYDITQRRQAHEMLKLQKSAMESALEGIMIVSDDGKEYPVIYANKELTNITGVNEDGIMGQAFMDAIGCPVGQKTKENILYSLRHHRSFKGEIKCRTNKQHGELVEDFSWRLLYIAPVDNEGADVNHFVAVLSDITDSKKVEKTLRDKNNQLLKTNSELDQFVYSTSHELRSPLMSVLGLVNLLEAETNDIERGAYIGMIRDTISRLDKIIHDIIDYSRNSRVEVLNENIDFEAFIYNAIENHNYVEERDKVQFNINIKNNTPFLSDKKRIEIIFNNFISNSLKFHRFDQEKPFITISVKTSPVNALITITDNGMGIDEKHLPHLYEMFYRGTEISTGSGIGLYIVKEIVDKLQGSIQVNSQVNEGTTFIIDLPNQAMDNMKLFSLNSFSYSEM